VVSFVAVTTGIIGQRLLINLKDRGVIIIVLSRYPHPK
jgi:NAD dependent epimerase/dehydratase family enzyme